MKTIYKYPLQVADWQEVLLPVGAKVLCVQAQRQAPPMEEIPCLWALVDAEEKDKLTHVIHTRGTGHIADGMQDHIYLGTYQLHQGALIFHVFHEEPWV